MRWLAWVAVWMLGFAVGANPLRAQDVSGTALAPDDLFGDPAARGAMHLPSLSPAEKPRSSSASTPGFGGPGGSREPGFSVTWYPAQDIDSGAGRLKLLREQYSLGGPVFRSDTELLILSIGVAHAALRTDALLPDSGSPVPGDLWNVSVNANYRHQFENGWSGSVLLGLGSASDRPFASAWEVNVTAGTVLRIPVLASRDEWLLSLMYLPQSTLNFPIPGAAYRWNPSADLQLQIGVPASVRWRATEQLTFDAMYIPLTNVRTRLTFQLAEPLAVFAGYESLTEAYFLADRSNRDERFMGFEQRLAGGWRWDFARYAAFNLQAGYVIERSFGRGESQGDTLRDRIDIAPGGFLEAGVAFHW